MKWFELAQDLAAQIAAAQAAGQTSQPNPQTDSQATVPAAVSEPSTSSGEASVPPTATAAAPSDSAAGVGGSPMDVDLPGKASYSDHYI